MSFSFFGDNPDLSLNYAFIFNGLTMMFSLICGLYTIYLYINVNSNNISAKQWKFFAIFHTIFFLSCCYISFNPYLISLTELKNFDIKSWEVFLFQMSTAWSYNSCYLMLGTMLLTLVSCIISGNIMKSISSKNILYLFFGIVAIVPFLLVIKIFMESVLNYNIKYIAIYPHIPIIIFIISFIFNLYIVYRSNKREGTNKKIKIV